MVALPGEGGAEEGEGLAGAGGGLEESVASALPAGAIEGGDDAPHEGELGAVGLEGELHGDAADLVDAGAAVLARVRASKWRRGIHRPILSRSALLLCGRTEQIPSRAIN